MKWTKENMPDQRGKTALVTGANTGIGYEIALALYQKGAQVIIACRSSENGEKAIAEIENTGNGGSLELGILDLASLKAVNIFTEEIRKKHRSLDLLINNAGVMTPPHSLTADGYELQFGVNFLGHYALTTGLYPLLLKTPRSRVVTLSSSAHRFAEKIDFSNLKTEKSYDANREYAISKLADLQLMLQLQRYFTSAGDDIISTAAHPGVTATNLSRHMPEEVYKAAMEEFKELMPAWQGALPALYAATSAEVKGGDYYGPDGKNELHGYPGLAILSNAAKDEASALKLWQFAKAACCLI